MRHDSCFLMVIVSATVRCHPASVVNHVGQRAPFPQKWRGCPPTQGICYEITAAVDPAAGQPERPAPSLSKRRAAPPFWGAMKSTPASRQPAMPCVRPCWQAARLSPASSVWKMAACAPSRSRSAPAAIFASTGSSGKRCATAVCTSPWWPTFRPSARSARPALRQGFDTGQAADTLSGSGQLRRHGRHAGKPLATAVRNSRQCAARGRGAPVAG